MGLCPVGQGARAAAEGETRLGGRIPISTSGRSHLARPSFICHLLYNYVELADQLRGRAGERQVKDAQFGVGTGELGNYNAALIHVLEAMQ